MAIAYYGYCLIKIVIMSDNDDNVKIDLSLSEESSSDKPNCYICKGTDGILVRPCTNSKCNARAHRACISQQVLKTKSKNNDKCACSNKIAQTSKVNRKMCWSVCCYNLAKLLSFIFLFFGSMLSVVLMALGNTITMEWIKCQNGKVSPCDDGAAGTIFFSFLFFPLFLQFHCKDNYGDKCCSYNIFRRCGIENKVPHKSKLTMLIMLLITHGLIFLAHCIGHPIIKYYFHKDVFFTWRTSLAGFIVYSMIIALALIVWTTYCIYFCVEDCAARSFAEVEYGVEVKEIEESEDSPLVM